MCANQQVSRSPQRPAPISEVSALITALAALMQPLRDHRDTGEPSIKVCDTQVYGTALTRNGTASRARRTAAATGLAFPDMRFRGAHGRLAEKPDLPLRAYPSRMIHSGHPFIPALTSGNSVIRVNDAIVRDLSINRSCGHECGTQIARPLTN